jgi:hypothetical protein
MGAHMAVGAGYGATGQMVTLSLRPQDLRLLRSGLCDLTRHELNDARPTSADPAEQTGKPRAQTMCAIQQGLALRALLRRPIGSQSMTWLMRSSRESLTEHTRPKEGAWSALPPILLQVRDRPAQGDSAAGSPWSASLQSGLGCSAIGPCARRMPVRLGVGWHARARLGGTRPSDRTGSVLVVDIRPDVGVFFIRIIL